MLGSAHAMSIRENPNIAEQLEEKSHYGKNSDEYRQLLAMAHVDPHIAANLKLAHDNARQILDYVQKEIANDPKTKARRALESGDFKKYRDLKNDEELAERRTGTAAARGSAKAALARGDFKSYKEIRNRQDLAKFRKGR